MAAIDQTKPEQKQSGAALRAFLTSAKATRAPIVEVLGSIQALFAKLQAEGMLVTKAARQSLRVSGAGRAVILEGTCRRDGEKVVPCITFRVGDRAVHLKLLRAPGGTAWTWSDGAGIGVDGQPISPETTSKVFLALLSGEV